MRTAQHQTPSHPVPAWFAVKNAQRLYFKNTNGFIVFLKIGNPCCVTENKNTTVTLREEGVGSHCPCTSHGRKVCRAPQRKAGSGRPSLSTDCSSPSVGAGELGRELVSDAKESPCSRGNGTGCSRSVPCSGEAGSHVPAAITGTSNEVRANTVRGCDRNGSCVPHLGYHLSPPFHQWERLASGVLAHVGTRGQAPGPDSQ